MSRRISKRRRNPNPNLNNLVIGFCHQSCTFWRISLNGYWLLLLGDFKEWVCREGGKRWSIYTCPYFCHVFSLLFTSFFLSFSPLFLLLVSYYSLVVGCFPFGLSFSWAPLSRCLSLSECLPQVLITLLPQVPLLGASLPSSMDTSSFYSELMQ